jgi:hypothetical protein
VQVEGLNIVVLGHFNPAIFSPAWLRMHGLIGEREADDATVQVIVSPAAVFSTDWLSVQVVEERMTLGTAMPQEYQRLRDVAVGTLSILNQTPIAAMGINLDAHWQISDLGQWHAFGDSLAPKERWDTRLALTGTQDLTVQGVRRDLWEGYVRVTVQPSGLVSPGIYARVNDHTVLRKVDQQPANREDADLGETPQPIAPTSDAIPTALEILTDEWDSRLEASESTIAMLMDWSNNG